MSAARSAITKLRLARSLGESQIGGSRSVESTRGTAIRCFSDDTGRVLSEEERAKESIKWRRRYRRGRKNSSNRSQLMRKEVQTRNLREASHEFITCSMQNPVIRQAVAKNNNAF